MEIFSGGESIPEIRPGGSMAISTTLDPSVVKSDNLTGSLVGIKGKLPPIHNQITIETHLLERVVGTKEETEVKPLAKNEILMLNVNSAATVGVVFDPSKKNTTCVLKKPVAANKGDRKNISLLLRKLLDFFIIYFLHLLVRFFLIVPCNLFSSWSFLIISTKSP